MLFFLISRDNHTHTRTPLWFRCDLFLKRTIHFHIKNAYFPAYLYFVLVWDAEFWRYRP